MTGRRILCFRSTRLSHGQKTLPDTFQIILRCLKTGSLFQGFKRLGSFSSRTYTKQPRCFALLTCWWSLQWILPRPTQLKHPTHSTYPPRKKSLGLISQRQAAKLPFFKLTKEAFNELIEFPTEPLKLPTSTTVASCVNCWIDALVPGYTLLQLGRFVGFTEDKHLQANK